MSIIQQKTFSFNNDVLDIWHSYLPPNPHVLRDKKHSSIISKNSKHFLKASHTQHNAINCKGTIVYDIDRDTNPIELFNDLHVPLPNLWVSNRDNGKGHAMYLLEVPVHLNSNSSNAPIKWATAIEQRYTKILQSDLSYSGYMSKNAFNQEAYRTSILNNNTYQLSDLWKYVSSEKFDARTKINKTGFGRNCTLFDAVRFQAYKEMRLYLESNNKPSFAYWEHAVHQSAIDHNVFDEPLHDKEVRQIARSIAKWVYSDYTPTTLAQRQSKRAKQGVLKAKQGKAISMADRGAIGGMIGKRPVNPLSARSQRPWEALGFSRRTYYRRLKNGTK